MVTDCPRRHRIGDFLAFDSDLQPFSQQPDRLPLICVGASVRAMAFSAIRAGFAPYCFDFFADVDLRRAVRDCGTTVTKIIGYDDATLRLIDALPSDIPLMYGGAVENHPEFVDAIASVRPVWGVTGDVLRRCRNPWIVQEVVERCGFSVLACHQERPRNGNWIWKPFASGGSLDIDNPSCGKPGYWQQKAQGRGDYSYFGVRNPEFGLSFLGQKDLGSVGETVSHRGIQIRDAVWHASDHVNFSGDVNFSDSDVAIAHVASDLGIRGCFGIDLFGDDTSLAGQHVLEVNPRFTSTAELHERVSGISFVAEQAKVFGNMTVVRLHQPRRATSRKKVFFAPYRLRCFICPPVATAGDFPRLADVPNAGSVIDADEPICTVFVDNEVAESGVFDSLEKSILGQCQRV